MCGIAGLMSADGSPPPGERLARMAAVLLHRGPDGTGEFHDGAVALAHRRLSIIDIAGGAQPIAAEGGVIVANAEIYNYRELRAALPDITFATASDCEPPLHLYRLEGTEFTARLRGMYALAIYDSVNEQLVLARDPFGIKPLYYHEGPGGFAFASEIGALVAGTDCARSLDENALHELLQLQFTTGSATILNGIKRVLPGETLTVSAGRVVQRSRRAGLPQGLPRAMGEAEALAGFDRVMRESVEFHQRADVPYGMFLSGGIDSSVLLSLMAELNDRPVRTYTAGFPGTGVGDERALAGRLARKLGADHVEIEVTAQDFLTRLPEVVAAIDDPAADYAVLPTWLLAERAHADGLKVVLCGEGGDELFAGYGRYRDAVRSWWTGGRRAMRRHGRFDRLDVLRDPPIGWRDGIAAAESALDRGQRNRLQLAQAVDCADWLPNDLLVKLDRCLMAHHVEGRTPFLDTEVAAFAMTLPDQLKIRRGRGKYLLRRWLEQRLPEADPFGRKRGFSVPMADWIAPHGHRLGELVAMQPGVMAVARPDRVKALFARAGKREALAAWSLLFYALWHRSHILGAATAGDIFETLSQPA